MTEKLAIRALLFILPPDENELILPRGTRAHFIYEFVN